MENPCKCGIEPPGFISHGISKPTRKRPLGRIRHRWEVNLRMDFKEISINTRNWIDSAEDRNYWRTLVNAALYLLVP